MLLDAQGYGPDRIVIDPSVVRGLGYYTGPVFEAELTFEITDDKGRPRQFGSVAGGGRYDDLVKRFTGQDYEREAEEGLESVPDIDARREEFAPVSFDRPSAKAAQAAADVLLERTGRFRPLRYTHDLDFFLRLAAISGFRLLDRELVRYHTTRDMTPEQVHEVGLAEVARIQGELRQAFGAAAAPAHDGRGPGAAHHGAFRAGQQMAAGEVLSRLSRRSEKSRQKRRSGIGTDPRASR